MRSDNFNFQAEFENAFFLLIGHGDGRGTEVVIGWDELWQRVRDDAGLELNQMGPEWEWSDEPVSKPFYLYFEFEDGGMTVVRLSDAAISTIRAS